MTTKPTAKPSPLGRGLSALFGDSDQGYQPRPPLHIGAVAATEPAQPPALPGVRQMPIEWIQPGAYQPRRRFDEAALQELASSIRERGVLQPLLVRPLPNEKDAYEIVAGERRWRASQIAGVHEVPVVVKQLTDRDAMEIGLIENVQREGLSVIEEAEGYQRLLEEFKYKQDDLAKIVGKSRPYISNALRLLSLSPKIRGMLDSGALTAGHARAVLSSNNPEALAEEIIKKGYSVRQAEEALKRETSKLSKREIKAATASADIAALEKDLSQSLGLKAKLNVKGKAGTLTLHYQSLDQLDSTLR